MDSKWQVTHSSWKSNNIGAAEWVNQARAVTSAVLQLVYAVLFHVFVIVNIPCYNTRFRDEIFLYRLYAVQVRFFIMSIIFPQQWRTYVIRK